jgi:hypothetical protein
MYKLKVFLTVAFIAVGIGAVLTGCDDDQPSAKSVQTQRAKEAANSINFADNVEIENIKKRLILSSKPGALGFVLLMNEMGQPVMYSSVKGKITSGNKRLTEPDRLHTSASNTVVRQSGSDEGTYGSSGEYIFFWNLEGQYIQWNGKYLYSDKPFRTSIEPLVINVAQTK